MGNCTGLCGDKDAKKGDKLEVLVNANKNNLDSILQDENPIKKDRIGFN